MLSELVSLLLFVWIFWEEELFSKSKGTDPVETTFLNNCQLFSSLIPSQSHYKLTIIISLLKLHSCINCLKMLFPAFDLQPLRCSQGVIMNVPLGLYYQIQAFVPIFLSREGRFCLRMNLKSFGVITLLAHHAYISKKRIPNQLKKTMKRWTISLIHRQNTD